LFAFSELTERATRRPPPGVRPVRGPGTDDPDERVVLGDVLVVVALAALAALAGRRARD
jgi:hypothetical protein